MSGHSKWHNIQKTKGAQDAKRAAAFTKISKEMIVAVKEGGGIADPAYNSRLATVITKAKAANMPNDNIKRVLEKAAASGSGDNYETITYEGHGPCGVAVIVETMTDNRNRTAGSVRHHFDKYGGSLGTTGCVSWSFDRKGVIVIDNEDEELDEDTVMMDALDAGAADFQPEEGCFTVYTSPDDINTAAKALEDKGYKFDSAQIEMVPQSYQKLDKQEDRDNMEKMLDLFEEDDDVQNVWHNWIRNKIQFQNCTQKAEGISPSAVFHFTMHKSCGSRGLTVKRGTPGPGVPRLCAYMLMPRRTSSRDSRSGRQGA